jgi:hypothetical protein
MAHYSIFPLFHYSMIAANIQAQNKFIVFSFSCRIHQRFYQNINICQFENIDKTGVGC